MHVELAPEYDAMIRALIEEGIAELDRGECLIAARVFEELRREIVDSGRLSISNTGFRVRIDPETGT